ncbi:helix-turn-helix domain-containing protein [Castellaniella sp. S9]|uniref:helix-turn-helix domain-containing protein n=1 Tax=Castellaniella sp. S9 TaxID=2993652 RepID=UPI0022B459DC|nr:helix-turn-helix domain-containing protein [Castellaniella sp. S9]
MMITLPRQLASARRHLGLSQEQLADRAGLSRMAVQKAESGATDPRLSTLAVMARAMGMELMLVPSAIRRDVQQFVQSGGRLLGQPPGVGAPGSAVDEVLGRDA